MKPKFITLKTVEEIEVAVNVDNIAAIYEHGGYRSIEMIGPPRKFIVVVESMNYILWSMNKEVIYESLD